MQASLVTLNVEMQRRLSFVVLRLFRLWAVDQFMRPLPRDKCAFKSAVPFT